MTKVRWKKVEPIEDPCPTCDGSGSEWKRRKDGQPDRRYNMPIGPCPSCHGSRRKTS